jgi:hypothetical protein
VTPSVPALRCRLIGHPLYAALDSAEALTRFQSRHVFLVWDFQTLLLALRLRLTRLSLPWMPTGDPLIRRLLNEIALGEESDEDGREGYLSHFELYLEAMRQSGADTGPITRFLGSIRKGVPADQALTPCGTSKAVQDFVRLTLRIAMRGSPHRIAAAFTIGREELVPDLFSKVVRQLATLHPGRFDRFRTYLERHIQIDAEEHGPASRRMVDILCQGNPRKRREAEATGLEVLDARLRLWDDIHREIPSCPSMTATISARITAAAVAAGATVGASPRS